MSDPIPANGQTFLGPEQRAEAGDAHQRVRVNPPGNAAGAEQAGIGKVRASMPCFTSG